MGPVNKKTFVKLFTASVKDSKYIQQAKLAKNLTELRTKIADIELFEDGTFTVLTKPIICQGVDFGQFKLTFSSKDPHNIWAEGGKLVFTYSDNYPDYACHMHIYQKNGIGIGKRKRVCLSERIDRAIAHFYAINDLSGVVTTVLNMFAGNKLTDGLGQHSWFHKNLKKCKVCDDRTNLVGDVCEKCNLVAK
jgi:hypothetical protein